MSIKLIESHDFQTTQQYLYIIRCFLLKYRLIPLRALTVFDEPLGESNTERQVKISASISKGGT